MDRWKLAGGIATLVVAGVTFLALPGRTAPKERPSAEKVDSVVGFVDLASVTEQIKQTPAWNVLVKKATDQQARYKDEFDGLLKTRYLSKPEHAELTNLRAKPKSSPAEEARIGALEKKSDELDKEYNSLSQVEKPTTEQSNRLKELAKLREDAIAALQDEKNKRQSELDKLQIDMLNEMQERIVKIVQTVAESKGIVLVVDRQAILYGGTDLTPDVVKKLPK